MVLTRIPRDEVVSLAVGERVELDTHRRVSAQLAVDLCKDAAAAAAPQKTAAKKAKPKATAKSNAPAAQQKLPCQPAQLKALATEVRPQSSPSP